MRNLFELFVFYFIKSTRESKPRKNGDKRRKICAWTLHCWKTVLTAAQLEARWKNYSESECGDRRVTRRRWRDALEENPLFIYQSQKTDYDVDSVGSNGRWRVETLKTPPNSLPSETHDRGGDFMTTGQFVDFRVSGMSSSWWNLATCERIMLCA